MERTGLFSVGYGNRPFPELRRVLEAHAIRHLVDVRSKPYSAYNPDFSRDRLKALLEEAGIRYTWLGDRLGGMPEGGPRRPDGSPDHAAIRRTPGFVDGLRRLAPMVRAERVAFLCAELRPERCHRFLLIGTTLAERGVAVLHIDGEGRPLTHGEVAFRATKGQATLAALPAGTG